MTRKVFALVLALAGLLGAAPTHAAPLREELLADFRDASAWQAQGSDQVGASLRRDADGSLCLDYDFGGVSGYAVMRSERPVTWPPTLRPSTTVTSRPDSHSRSAAVRPTMPAPTTAVSAWSEPFSSG